MGMEKYTKYLLLAACSDLQRIHHWQVWQMKIHAMIRMNMCVARTFFASMMQ